MKVQGITFDFDGTLADTLPVCYAAFRSVFRRYLGREFSDEEIHDLFGPCEKGVLSRLMPDWREPFAMYLQEYEASHGRCRQPFPGVPELLDALAAAGVRVAIVTGKGAESAAISLREVGLCDRFAIVEAGTPEGAVKADAIRRILDEWRLPPDLVAHVGDAPNDIRAAKETGLVALAAAWAPAVRLSALEAESPDALFSSVEGLRNWLETS
ncbi:MAG TPA: HAD-IA family hydrolase [Fimbriimonadaceae bacterium]|nr:HAD-IA family hydrolase [Fimbriimonadaceae bacterium]